LEKWRPIKGYKKLYLISDKGRIKSLKSDKIRKLSTTKDGYHTIRLSKKGIAKTYLVHRLLALAFISNESSKPIVNHRNSKRNDNRVSNLEWVTPSENSSHSVNQGNRGRKVEQFTINGTLIAVFSNMSLAAKTTNTNRTSIYMVCVGKRKTANNFKWNYYENN